MKIKYKYLDKYKLLGHIFDEFESALNSDLEHGIKALNEKYAKKFMTEYPEINKFYSYLFSLREIYGLDE
ncbi:hypothetical protein UFOVP22_23 [uncultured Caudovirales phage]|uniref:Uncharacterized protein n=1 Tax=uncultured Caudovirales phage TaxID=2100421 RepID=A0A6J5T810_9CAUD|nr:hypothetical protein UFOVP22_23 [uncultured Caudovirales phage]